MTVLIIIITTLNLVFILFRFFPTRRNIKSWKLDRQINKSLLSLIDRRRRIAGDGREGPKDLLGLMIRAADSAAAPSSISVSDIVEECKGFFFAGKHSTSNMLTWTTVLLAMHPQWQEMAREEVVRVCGERDMPTKDHVVKLKTVSTFSFITLFLQKLFIYIFLYF